jgi:hypothetical protein
MCSASEDQDTLTARPEKAEAETTDTVETGDSPAVDAPPTREASDADPAPSHSAPAPESSRPRQDDNAADAVPSSAEPQLDPPSGKPLRPVDPDPLPEMPDTAPEPLSTRDIEQIVVPQSFYQSSSEEALETLNAATAGRMAAFRPVDLASLAGPETPGLDAPDRESVSGIAPDSVPEPLSARDLEEVTWHGEDPSRAPELAEPRGDRSLPRFPDAQESLDASRAAPFVLQPSAVKKRSVPPPLPRPSDRPGLAGPPLVPAELSVADPSVSANLGKTTLERLAAADYEGAFMAANTLLRHDPRSEDALQAAQIARSELYKTYDARLGARQRVPHVAVRTEDIRSFPLDACSALVLSQVDGIRTIDDIIHGGILPKLDVLRVLSELYLQGILAFTGGTARRDEPVRP